MSCLQPCISVGEVRREDVTYAEAVSADLVSISRADTLEGRTDLALAHCSFVCCVEEPVGREDEVCLLCDHDTLSHRNSCLCRNVIAFSLESDRVEDHAVADNVLRIISEDS